MDEIERLKVLDEKEFNNLQRRIFSTFLKEYFSGEKDKVKILEAGCGEKWNFILDGIDCLLTGLDISKEALEVRKYKQKDLDEIIIGDLRTVELKNAEYDVIYCAYVLEHIIGAEEVLDRFFRWLKPKGLLVLLIPDRNTFFGLVTRFTPFWFHIFFYKYIVKNPKAGKIGHGPFQTFYDKVVSRRGICDYCCTHGYKIHVEYGSKLDTNRIFGLLSPLFDMFLKLVSIVSFGKLTSNHGALLYVIEKS